MTKRNLLYSFKIILLVLYMLPGGTSHAHAQEIDPGFTDLDAAIEEWTGGAAITAPAPGTEYAPGDTISVQVEAREDFPLERVWVIARGIYHGTTYTSADPAIVRVTDEGLLLPRNNGRTVVTVRNSGLEAEQIVSILGFK